MTFAVITMNSYLYVCSDSPQISGTFELPAKKVKRPLNTETSDCFS